LQVQIQTLPKNSPAQPANSRQRSYQPVQVQVQQLPNGAQLQRVTASSESLGNAGKSQQGFAVWGDRRGGDASKTAAGDKIASRGDLRIERAGAVPGRLLLDTRDSQVKPVSNRDTRSLPETNTRNVSKPPDTPPAGDNRSSRGSINIPQVNQVPVTGAGDAKQVDGEKGKVDRLDDAHRRSRAEPVENGAKDMADRQERVRERRERSERSERTGGGRRKGT
jgi:hypothetical protein